MATGREGAPAARLLADSLAGSTLALRSALELVIRSLDLTSLEGSETPETIRALCAKAVRPDPHDDSVPSVAAVCVYPRLVPVAVAGLRGTDVKVAAVAGGFPSGQTPLEARLFEIRRAVETGADEVDIVLNRSLFLSGRRDDAFDELVASREAARGVVLKVILETGELRSDDAVAEASALAMAAGADFIKTSTGKLPAGADPRAAMSMMRAIANVHAETGRAVGLKVSGGVRTAAAALEYLALAHRTLGPNWLTPDLFRIGASSLLGDLVAALRDAHAEARPPAAR